MPQPADRSHNQRGNAKFKNDLDAIMVRSASQAKFRLEPRKREGQKEMAIPIDGLEPPTCEHEEHARAIIFSLSHADYSIMS